MNEVLLYGGAYAAVATTFARFFVRGWCEGEPSANPSIGLFLCGWIFMIPLAIVLLISGVVFVLDDHIIPFLKRNNSKIPQVVYTARPPRKVRKEQSRKALKARVDELESELGLKDAV